MNFVRSSGIRLGAALALSLFLLVGSTHSSASPITAEGLPTISIWIEDGPNPNKWSWTPSENDLRPAPAVGRGKYLGASKQFDILSNRAHVVIEGLEFDPDPFVLNNILVTKHGVTVVETPKEVLDEILKAWDRVAERKAKENPFFAKVLESQKAYASLVVPAKRFLFPPYSFAANYYWPEEKPAAKAAKK